MIYLLYLFVSFGIIALLFAFIYKPIIYIYSLIISLYILPYFIQVAGIFPSAIASYFRYLDDLMVLFALVHLVIIVFRNGSITAPAGKYVGLFFVIFLLSFFANRPPLTSGFNFIFSFLKPIIIFYYVINVKVFERDYKNIFLTLVLIGIIQMLFNLGWLLEINPFPNPDKFPSPDFAIGTFGRESSRAVANYLALLSLSLIVVFYAYVRKKLIILLVFFFLIGIFLAESKTTVGLYFISVIITLVAILRVKVLKMILFGVLFTIVTFIIMIRLEPELVDLYRLYAKLETSDQPKIIAYENILFKLGDEVPILALGAGPGMYGSTIAIKNQTPLAMKYVINPLFYGTNTFLLDRVKGLGFGFEGIGFQRTTGFVGIAGDIGIFGLIVYLMIYLKGFKIAYFFGKEVSDKYLKSVSLSISAGMIYILLYNIFNDLFSDFNITFPIWFFLGVIYNQRNQLLPNRE